MNSYIKTKDILQPYTASKLGSSLIEDWTRDQKLNRDLVNKFCEIVGGNVYVRILPRRMVKTVWNHEMPSKPFPNKKYAFRAFARGSMITIFDDATETNYSLSWILLHELAHVKVTRNDKLREQFRSIKHPGGYLTSDAAHESSPEEQFANLVADKWFKDFYKKSGSYHRIWWRNRVIAQRSL